MKSLRQHPIVTGTLVLTATGFISRIIGFFYRIYLSRLFGAEGMGIYQLLSPVLSISFSLTAAAYQTAISKSVAELAAKRKQVSYLPLFIGLSISLPLSLACAGIVFSAAQWIGTSLLGDVRTVSMLRILAFSIPLSAVHSCVNGFYYGIKKAGFPAIAQLVEQIIRVSCVIIISAYATRIGGEVTINIAVLGLTVGELASMLLSVTVIYLRHAGEFRIRTKQTSTPSLPNLYRTLMAIVIPLTANRLVLNLLHSAETVSIPARLKLYGYDTSTALSVYGVLTGMAMPLIFFPCAVTNSVAVLLLPVISEQYALGNLFEVRRSTKRTIKYCLLLGIPCMAFFTVFGKWLGLTLFDSTLAGHFITTLGFLCPFIYLDTTLSSILNGLGMTGHLFLFNLSSLVVRLLFVFGAIPQYGISGYLWGLLTSQLLLTVLYLWCLYRFFYRQDLTGSKASVHFPWKPSRMPRKKSFLL